MTNILIAEKEFSQDAKKILAKCGKVYDFKSHGQFFKNLKNADALVTGLEIKLSKDVLTRAPRLKLIGSRTTQLRYIDLNECKRRGIKVVNIKADSPVLRKTPSTAEETIALMLALMRKIPWAFESLKRKEWKRKYYGGFELYEKTIGLIGFGRLGKLVAGYSKAFGMKILAYDPYVGAGIMKRCGVKKTGLDALLRLSDIVSVHAIYDEKTFGMLRTRHFGLIKKGAFFINTARGEITDERALLLALKEKRLAGAAVDTLAGEGPRGEHLKNNPLVEYARTHENLIIVPHLGGATAEATERTQIYISDLVAKELRKL